MKSDREFIDGIYAKAEQKKQQKSPFLKFRRIAAVPIAAAAVIFIVWNLEKYPVKLQLPEDIGNSVSPINLEHGKGRTIAMEYSVEGTVIEVLEPYMGYGRIRLQVNAEGSTLQEGTVIIAYPEETAMYKKGDYVTATLIQQQLGTQEYYVIAD